MSVSSVSSMSLALLVLSVLSVSSVSFRTVTHSRSAKMFQTGYEAGKRGLNPGGAIRSADTRATMVSHPSGDEDWYVSDLVTCLPIKKDRISSHEMSLFSRTTGSPLMQSTLLDAIGVAVQQASVEGKNRWYTSTKELQLVSLGLCRACRDVRTLSVRVTVDSPRSLWRLGYPSLPSTLESRSLASSRVPSIKPSV